MKNLLLNLRNAYEMKHNILKKNIALFSKHSIIIYYFLHVLL